MILKLLFFGLIENIEFSSINCNHHIANTIPTNKNMSGHSISQIKNNHIYEFSCNA